MELGGRNCKDTVPEGIEVKIVLIKKSILTSSAKPCKTLQARDLIIII